MASTRTRPAADHAGFTVPGFAGPTPTLRRSRNLPGAFLGILLVVVCSLAVATLASSNGQRTQVLIVVKPIAAGTPIQAGSLRSAGVAADGIVRGIRASQAATVIGRIAADNLVPGTLLVGAELATGPRVAKGRTIVGLALKPGFLPGGLSSQDTVTVVDTPASSATSSANTAGAILASNAVVYSVGAAPDGQASLVSVEVPAANAAAVAEANAQGSVSLVLVGG
ncbi:MAG: SAF domain-containing protein [Actinomycetota bacterium]|nr:SAF domain-containing protein [Actinomycetota bacterium]MDQ6944820.1 SAF domain-containing protein [Actinomycetota bacterium]